MGAAGITSGVIILIVGAVPLAKRPKYQGMFGAVFGVASVVGPLLGVSQRILVRCNFANGYQAAFSPPRYHGDGAFTSICPSVQSLWCPSGFS